MIHLLLQNRVSAGFGGLLEQFHTRLRRRATSFFGITAMAGTDDIFPVHPPSLGARDDMVQTELFQAVFSLAVLAAITVSDKDIATIEFDRIIGDAIIAEQTNHTRNLNFEVDRENPVLEFISFIKFRSQLTDFNPGTEVIVHEAAIFNADDFRDVFTKQAESSLGGDDMDRRISLVQRQHARLHGAGLCLLPGSC